VERRQGPKGPVSLVRSVRDVGDADAEGDPRPLPSLRQGGQRKLFALARKDFDLRGDPPPEARKHRRKGLPPADPDALAFLTPAMRRALWALLKLAKGSQWFEARQRYLTETCRVSGRDAIPPLDRLATLRLIRVRSNKYRLKRPTQVCFLVDPADLERRLSIHNGEPFCGVMKHQNGVTMERRGAVRTRDSGLQYVNHKGAGIELRRDQSATGLGGGELLTEYVRENGFRACRPECVRGCVHSLNDRCGAQGHGWLQ
jgi:hypothetical protein